MEQEMEEEMKQLKLFCSNKPKCSVINMFNLPHGIVNTQDSGIIISNSKMTQKRFIELILHILHKLPFLKILKIQLCINISDIPEILFTGLPNLNALFLINCDMLGPLPKNIGYISKNLKTLKIFACPLATCLPPSIGMLNDLNSHMDYWCKTNIDDRNLQIQIYKMKKDYHVNVTATFTTLLCSLRYSIDPENELAILPGEIWEYIFSYFEIFKMKENRLTCSYV